MSKDFKAGDYVRLLLSPHDERLIGTNVYGVIVRISHPRCDACYVKFLRSVWSAGAGSYMIFQKGRVYGANTSRLILVDEAEVEQWLIQQELTS